MKSVTIWVLSLVMSTSVSAEVQPQFSSRSDVAQFINQLVKNDHFKRDELTTVLNQVELQPAILEKIQKPYETKPWYAYRNFFMTEERLNRGVEFWHEHEKELQRAEREYGVPPEVIVSIIGVETLYGTFRGDYRVLDSLSTLAFNYPPRSVFFKSELRNFLLLAREQQFSPTELKGSYAGAMGYPQFMPSSYRNFAVDFNGNGKIDLLKTPADSIGSVGNYFKMHGWQQNQPIATLANIQTRRPIRRYLDKPTDKATRYRPQWRIGSLHDMGIEANIVLDPEIKACLLDMQEVNGMKYWLGFNNLYVITRYNSSINYAMVVYDLSQRLKAAHEALAENPASIQAETKQ